uniref:Uncharacterized protein n=1 Tax=Amphimedon queenslandica TaxID=400682 RepID=A0A1X7VXI1_AMPQE
MSLVQPQLMQKERMSLYQVGGGMTKKRHPQVSLCMAERLANNRVKSCTSGVLNKERFHRRLEEGYGNSHYDVWKNKPLSHEKCVSLSHNIGLIAYPYTPEGTPLSFLTSIPFSFDGTDSIVFVGITMYIVAQRKPKHVTATSKSTVLSNFISQGKPEAAFKSCSDAIKSCEKIVTSGEN